MMNLDMGETIAALRKKLQMTQEQLAAAVGVSPPAVSKWEKNKSYPDITLLCPLARALNTDVDSLLSFKKTLSDAEMAKEISEIMHLAEQQGQAAAETRLNNLLEEYPFSIPIKYNAAAVLCMFETLSYNADESKKAEWKKRRRELWLSIRESGSAAYAQLAIQNLASIALSDGEIDYAESLLRELPQYETDPTTLKTQLYLKRGDPQKARETQQKRLLTLVGQMGTCLIQLLSEELTPQIEDALKIGELCRQAEAMFGLTPMSDGVMMELYLRAGDIKEALACFTRYADTLTSPLKLPPPYLFSAISGQPEKKKCASRPIRQMVLKAVMEEDSLAPLRGEAEFEAAAEKIRKSIENDEEA